MTFTLLSVPLPWFRISASQFRVPTESLPKQMLLTRSFPPPALPLLLWGWSRELEAQKLQITRWDKNNLLETEIRKLTVTATVLIIKGVRQRNDLHGKLRPILTNTFPTMPLFLLPEGKVLLSPLWQRYEAVLSSIVKFAMPHPTDGLKSGQLGI